MFKNHPKGLLTAALSNMGERFGYYIMNAVLVLFLCSKFGLSEAASGTIYSFFYAGIYILSLVGGLIADRTQNYKGTIKTGLVVMATGYIILSIPILATAANTTWLLTLTCFALFLIAFGNGLFKEICRQLSARCMIISKPKLPRKARKPSKSQKTNGTPDSRFFMYLLMWVD